MKKEYLISSLFGVFIVMIFVGAGCAYMASDDKMMESDGMMQDDQMEAMEDNMMQGDLMNDDAMMMEEDAMQMEGDSMMKDEMEESAMMTGAGTYEPYSEEKLAKANEGDVVLFFRASWCPSCKVVDADIKANLDSIPEDLTILDVDYDNSTELKRKYGVTYQHTFVQVDAQGNQIKKWSGSSTLAAIEAEVN